MQQARAKNPSNTTKSAKKMISQRLSGWPAHFQPFLPILPCFNTSEGKKNLGSWEGIKNSVNQIIHQSKIKKTLGGVQGW